MDRPDDIRVSLLVFCVYETIGNVNSIIYFPFLIVMQHIQYQNYRIEYNYRII